MGNADFATFVFLLKVKSSTRDPILVLSKVQGCSLSYLMLESEQKSEQCVIQIFVMLYSGSKKNLTIKSCLNLRFMTKCHTTWYLF